MQIMVYVTSNARESGVVKVSEDYFEVRVDERSVGGRANKRLVGIPGRTVQGPKIANLHSRRNKIKKQDRPSNSRAYSRLAVGPLTSFSSALVYFCPYGNDILEGLSLLWLATNPGLIMVTVFQPSQRME